LGEKARRPAWAEGEVSDTDALADIARLASYTVRH